MCTIWLSLLNRHLVIIQAWDKANTRNIVQTSLSFCAKHAQVVLLCFLNNTSNKCFLQKNKNKLKEGSGPVGVGQLVLRPLSGGWPSCSAPSPHEEPLSDADASSLSWTTTFITPAPEGRWCDQDTAPPAWLGCLDFDFMWTLAFGTYISRLL